MNANLSFQALQAVMDSMSANIAILDSQGIIVAVNAAWVRYAEDNHLGKKGDGLGMSYLDICAPAAKAKDPDSLVVHAALQAILSGTLTDAFHHEYLCPHPGDPSRDAWYHLCMQPFQIQGRLHVDVSHENITQRHQANRNRVLLESAVNHVAAGVLVTDKDGNIQYANPGFLEMTGYASYEVLGQHTRILKSGRTPEGTHALIWKTILSGKTWRGTLCNRRKDGQFYWEKQTISPIVDPAGVITNFVAVKEDVTDSYQNRRLFSGMVRSSVDAYLAIDSQGLIMDWSPNAEHLFEISQADAIGQSFLDLTMESAVAANIQREIQSFLALGKSMLFEKPRKLDLHTGTGTVFPAELSLLPVDLDNEWRFTGFVRDLSDAVQSEQQLVQAQKLEAIGQLSGGMAHDFNNILGIISGSLELLVTQLGDQNKFLNIARDATNRATEVTKSLMSVARRRPLNPIDIDVNAAIREMAPVLQQTVGKSIQLDLMVDGPSATVRVEPTGLNNAIVNLVINSRDALTSGGRIMVYTYPMWVAEEFSDLGLDLQEGQYLVIGVDDTGLGMSASVKAKAFEPFFTTKEEGKGTGMGLAMVYGFCRRSGGIARIESEPNKGCSVQMMLPVRTDKSANEDGANRQAGQRALIVDSDPKVLRLVRRYLHSLGMEVYSVTSPTNALYQISLRDFDLVMTDIPMAADLESFDLVRRVLALAKVPRVILMMQPDQNVPLDAAQNRLVTVQKPLHVDALSVAVAECFPSRKAVP